MNNRPLLISLLVIVAVARFGVSPWVEWQSEQTEYIERLRQQAAKADQLIAQQSDYQKAAATLSEANRLASRQMFLAADNTKLVMQQHLEASLKQHNLSLTRFDWVLNASGDIERHVAVVALEGKLEALQAWQMEMSKNTPWWYVNEWRIRRANSRDNDISRFQGDITLSAFATKLGVVNAE